NMKERAKIVDDPTPKRRTPASPPDQYPPPHVLAGLAEREKKRKRVDEYVEVISKLRDEKGFTYRAIAQWLCEHGVPTDHNEVYRTHKDYCEAAPKRFIERNLRGKILGNA